MVVAHATYLENQVAASDSLAELLGRHAQWMDARAVLATHNHAECPRGREAVGRAGERLPLHREPTLCSLAGDHSVTFFSTTRIAESKSAWSPRSGGVRLLS